MGYMICRVKTTHAAKRSIKRKEKTTAYATSGTERGINMKY
jgi:hypothetical protein